VNPHVADEDAVGRAAALLLGSRFLVLATADATGPWAATVNHVVSAAGTLLFCSDPRSRHIRQLAATRVVAATTYTTEPGQVPLDGVQLRGRCSRVGFGQLADRHEEFFTKSYPDPATRVRSLIPLRNFRSSPGFRLYEIDILGCWVRDLRARREERLERRTRVPLLALRAALAA
jgi:uncharacterized protein YhbP (UPF0306 family)